MKSVKSVPNFWQIDHKVKNILAAEGVIVLSSPEAWKKFRWTRRWFKKKPREGYFVWVKKQVSFPLSTCITMASPKISQNLTNLLIIEKGLSIKANVVCNAAKNNLYGSHKAKGKLILKEGAFLDYHHFHRWGEKDFVSPDYEFILGKGTKLIYNYKNLFPPKNLELKTTVHNSKDSSSNLNFIISGFNSRIKIEDSVFLEGRNSQGVVRMRLVGRKRSEIEAVSRIAAQDKSRGHLDCQGLLLSETSKISLIPQLICKNKEAQITHEASIGKISEEQLNYLRMRGLPEKEAIDLIVGGFLTK